MTHWTSVIVAPRDRCRAGIATLTTVPSMNVIADARIVATSVKRAFRGLAPAESLTTHRLYMIPAAKMLCRGGFAQLHAIGGAIWLLAEELDPLLLERRVVFRGLHQVGKAAHRLDEPFLDQLVRNLSLGRERLVRLCEREHVGVDAHAQVLERNTQRPEPTFFF